MRIFGAFQKFRVPFWGVIRKTNPALYPEIQLIIVYRRIDCTTYHSLFEFKSTMLPSPGRGPIEGAPKFGSRHNPMRCTVVASRISNN